MPLFQTAVTTVTIQNSCLIAMKTFKRAKVLKKSHPATD